VLPNTDYPPPHSAEFPEISLIPLARLADFFPPEGRHTLFPRREAITMPKIAIHKNRYSFLPKHDIRFSRQTFDVGLKLQTQRF
jgi:hypothetical protein